MKQRLFTTNYIDHSGGYAAADPNLPNQVSLYVCKGESPGITDNYIFSFFDAEAAEELGRDLIRAAKYSRTKEYVKEYERLRDA